MAKTKKVSRSILLGLQSSDRHCKQARGAGILLTKNNIQYISQHIPTKKHPTYFPIFTVKNVIRGFPIKLGFFSQYFRLKCKIGLKNLFLGFRILVLLLSLQKYLLGKLDKINHQRGHYTKASIIALHYTNTFNLLKIFEISKVFTPHSLRYLSRFASKTETPP